MPYIKVVMEIDANSITELTKERIRLPIQRRGMGLCSLVDHRHSEYIGGMVQGITPLLDRKNGDKFDPAWMYIRRYYEGIYQRVLFSWYS